MVRRGREAPPPLDPAHVRVLACQFEEPLPVSVRAGFLLGGTTGQK